MPKKSPKVKLGLKNLAMFPNYFDYIFVHPRQKIRLRPEFSLKFLLTSGLNRLEPYTKSPARLTTLGRIHIVRDSEQFEDFRNIFLPNIGEDQKINKIIPSECGVLYCPLHHMVNSALIIALRSQKR